MYEAIVPQKRLLIVCKRTNTNSEAQPDLLIEKLGMQQHLGTSDCIWYAMAMQLIDQSLDQGRQSLSLPVHDNYKGCLRLREYIKS